MTLADQWQDAVNQQFETIVGHLYAVLFYAVPVGYGVKFPVVLLVLIFGGIFFTLRFGFVNVRMFRHSLLVIRGCFDSPEDEGEVRSPIFRRLRRHCLPRSGWATSQALRSLSP